MDYKVLVTSEAENDLNRFVQYLLWVKKCRSAAKNVLDDFEVTVERLKYTAGSLKLCENPRLKKLGYRRMNFLRHRYFLLYRVEGKLVYVDSVFHELQDYENKIK